MKLQQLRYIWEVARHELNVSMTAQSLYTSQPGISKQIRMLEDELGVEIFSRSGKHLTRITPAGEAVLNVVGDILHKVDVIKQLAQEFNNEQHGSLALATTHTQARYALPSVITSFIQSYPEVALHIHQGTPMHVAEMAAEGSVDFAIATEALTLFNELIILPCYTWNHVVVVPQDHQLCHREKLTLEDLAAFSLVTYVQGFTGRSKIDAAFLAQDLAPKIVFTASDADVIKTYVQLGLGVGIISKMAAEKLDPGLVVLDVSHLFVPSITSIAFRKGTFMRGFMYAFIEKFAPHLTRDLIDTVLQCANRSEIENLFNTVELPSI